MKKINFIPRDQLVEMLGGTEAVAKPHKGPKPALRGLQQTLLTSTPQQQPKQAAATPVPEPEASRLEDLQLPEALTSRLYEHQKQGVEWLYTLHSSRYMGGILGDDMGEFVFHCHCVSASFLTLPLPPPPTLSTHHLHSGLGKTFQVVCFLTGLFRIDCAKRVLIVAPVSVLQAWQRELSQHMKPNVRRVMIETLGSDTSKKKRQRLLADTFQSRYPSVVISSYQLISNMIEDFAQGEWDYVILDEGHCIKNPSTKLTKAMHCLPSVHRLILTGTPVQNHLSEFWALLDWCTGGGVFGSRKEFSDRFETPILAGRNPTAGAHERAMAQHASKQLAVLTRPILLQRKKSDSGMETVLHLPAKTELVVWVAMSTTQRRIYEKYLQTREVELAVNRSQYPVEVINHLKTVCRHPFLIEASVALKKRAKEKSGAFVDCEDEDLEADVADLEQLLAAVNVGGSPGPAAAATPARLDAGGSVWAVAGRHPEIEELMEQSVKLEVTIKMALNLVAAGHRILVFSQSRLMCDILESALKEVGLASCRIDGTVTGKERQRIIDFFNTGSERSPPIALLTTRACGTGITLTGADRVIIHDPSWNPAEDKQAVDRAFRIGQTRDVVVYRLISAGGVEEKIYEKQVFKDGVRVVLETGDSNRYFSSAETKKLFTLCPAEQCDVMQRLWVLQGEEIRSWDDCGMEADDVGLDKSVLGFSRHDALYKADEMQGEQARTGAIATPATLPRPPRRVLETPKTRVATAATTGGETSPMQARRNSERPATFIDLTIGDSPPVAAAGRTGPRPDAAQSPAKTIYLLDSSSEEEVEGEGEGEGEDAGGEEADWGAPAPAQETQSDMEQVDDEQVEPVLCKTPRARRNIVLSDSEDEGEEANETEQQHEQPGSPDVQPLDKSQETQPFDDASAAGGDNDAACGADKGAVREEKGGEEEEGEEEEEEEDCTPESSPTAVPSSVGSVVRIPMHTPIPPLSAPGTPIVTRGENLPGTNTGTALRAPGTLARSPTRSEGSPLPAWERINVSAHWGAFQNPYGESDDEDEEEEDDEGGGEHEDGAGIGGVNDEDEAGSLADFIVNDSDEEIEIEEEEEEEDEEDEEEEEEEDEEEEGEDADGEKNEGVADRPQDWDDARSPTPSHHAPLEQTLDFSHFKRAPLMPLPVSIQGRLDFCADRSLSQACSSFSDSLQQQEQAQPKSIMALSEEEVHAYNSFLERAFVCSPSASGIDKREQQAANLAAALSICDQDENLHGRLAYIFQRLVEDDELL